MRARRINLIYRLKWPWLYLTGFSSSRSIFNWVNPLGKGSRDHELELVFMGDLLGMGQKELTFSKELISWIGRPDYIFFNLEAQLSSRPHLPLVRQSFRNARFFKTLKALFLNTKIVASVANNHFFDFSPPEREYCFKTLRETGIELIGFSHLSSLEIADNLRLHCHTAWVDQWGGAALIEDFKPRENEQSILFVHAGREFSLEPQEEMMDFEKSLHPSVMALIGHHTHRPSGIEWKAKRFVAWSLGNICTPFGGGPVRWGQAVKLRLKKSEGHWEISDALWTYIFCDHQQVVMKRNYSKLNFQW